MAQPHEFGGAIVRLPPRRSGIRARHCQACLTHTAITPPAGQSVRSKATLRGDAGSIGDVVPHRQQASSRIWRVATSPTRVLQAQITQRCTRYVALHPIRRAAPDQKGCNAYGSGAPPPTTSPIAGNSSPQTPTGSIGRRQTASKREAMQLSGD